MRNQRGFSLVELMIAMTVTLIVSGAIYGLLASGSNAFRREPEMADRQQNIRVAMDLIARDVYTAGAGLPSFAQVFRGADPAGGCATLNGCGPAGTMGPGAAANRGGDSQNSDVVEMVSTDEQCPPLAVCSDSPTPGTAGRFVTQEARPSCLGVPGLALLAADGGFTVASIQTAGAGVACTGGGGAPNANFMLTAFLEPFVPGGFAGTNPVPPGAGTANSVYIYRARLARYRIAGDPTDGTPSLWRSETGRYLPAGGAAVPDPGTAGFDPTNTPWELVARGIEDLQIEYRDGSGPNGVGAWLNSPPVAVLNGWDNIVRQVRITLSARASARNLQGETAPAGGVGPTALRGELSTVVTPRPAFQELQNCRAPATNKCDEDRQIQ